MYRKYHFRRQIEILRVRCRACRVTHALIPSFSLPGTSGGTEEAEAYLRARAEGVSRSKAAEVFAGCAVGEDYPKRLERMLATAVQMGKALLVGFGDERLSGLGWIVSVCGRPARPLYGINCFGLEHRVNGLCFCRRWLVKYCRTAVGRQFSHNPVSTAGGKTAVDSG